MPLHDENQTIQKAATGQPFKNGMLYDCRSDTLIRGLTLWDEDYLQENLQETPLQSSNFQIEQSDSLNAKADLLNIEASLKLSILGGLIDISGAGSYLKDRVSSSLQERVTMRYECTTRAENLTMAHLGKDRITHPEVFANGIATHVVTGITYGARACLTFDRKYESSEERQEASGALQAAIKKIPFVDITGEGKLKMDKNEQETANKMTCTFHGDFIPEENPTSYQQAVMLYKNISQQLGENNEKAVPVEVFLLPLKYLDQKAAVLAYNIEDDLVEKTTNVLENLHALDVKCNYLLETKACTMLKYSAKKIRNLQKLGSRYETFFQKQIAQILPKIRGGEANVAELSEILMTHEKSPFSGLLDVAAKYEIEINILTKYLEYLSDIRFVTPLEFDSVIFDPTLETVACFQIKCPATDPSAEQLERYLENQDTEWEAEQTIEPKSKGTRKLVKKARMFLEFWKANKESGMEFILNQTLEDVDHVTAQIDIYQGGEEMAVDFDPPTCSPPKCKALSADSIEVTWDIKSGDNTYITGFAIKYTDNDEVENEVELSDSTLTKHTLTDLTPSKSYIIAVRVQTQFGYGSYVAAKRSINPGM